MKLFLTTEEKPEGKKRLHRGLLFATSSSPPVSPLWLKNYRKPKGYVYYEKIIAKKMDNNNGCFVFVICKHPEYGDSQFQNIVITLSDAGEIGQLSVGCNKLLVFTTQQRLRHLL